MAKRKRKQQNDQKLSQPLRPTVLKEYGAFEGLDYPADEFDYDNYSRTYWLYTIGSKWGRHRGLVTIKRSRKSGSGLIRYEVEESIIHPLYPSLNETKTIVECTQGIKPRPVRWSLEYKVTHLNTQRFTADTAFTAEKLFLTPMLKEQGFIEGNVLTVKSHGKTFSRRVPDDIVYNWAVFDLVSQMGREKMKETDFAVIVDMDQILEGQSVRFRSTERIPFAGKEISANTYLRTGAGQRAWLYYLDGEGRLLTGITGVLSYVLLSNQSAEEKHQYHENVIEKIRQCKGKKDSLSLISTL